MLSISPFQKRIHCLPNEIQYHILSYTYTSQQKALLEDIRDFSETLQLLQYYTEELPYLENNVLVSAADDIHNELYVYIHYYLCDGSLEMVANMFWKRYFMFYPMTIERMSNYQIVNFTEYPLNTQIRFVWGLLLPSERNEFLDFYEEDLFFDDEEDEDEDEDEEDYDF